MKSPGKGRSAGAPPNDMSSPAAITADSPSTGPARNTQVVVRL